MDAAPPLKAASASEVFQAFFRLGLTAFGGTAGHLAAFRREFVERRGWLSATAFDEYVALAAVLPGPTSSQVGLALGLRQAGVAGALTALAGFVLPAAAALAILAILWPDLELRLGAGWVHGLTVAAAAILLQALVQMARTAAAGPVRAGMAIGAAIGLVLTGGAVANVAVLMAGALFGFALLGEAAEAPEAKPEPPPLERESGAVALAIFAGLLLVLPLLAVLLANPGLDLAGDVYRAGAFTFGSEHLLLPLLHDELVERGAMHQEVFVAGYGAAQALPGPLAAFAAFVGAAQASGPHGAPGAFIAAFAVVLPGLLLMAGALPFWERMRAEPRLRGAAAGAAAAATGMLAAALWDPVLATAVQRPSDWALVAGAYVFLAVARLPAWVVVVGFAAAVGLLSR